MVNGSSKSDYLNENDIVNELYKKLASEDFEIILNIKSKFDMIQYHHSVGRWIRNEFRLWDKNNPYTQFVDENSENHPDQMSNIILMKLWEKVHNGQKIL